MPNIAIVVPARLDSKRFPHKLLYPILGKPLILWTAERIAKQAPDVPLYFAVEDEVLLELLEKQGYQPIMTSRKHQSGTDRISEANECIQANYLINVQADEPLVTEKQIKTLSQLITSADVDMATLATPFEKEEDFHDPDKVKVVLNTESRALFFSRSAIPFSRDHNGYVDSKWLQENLCYWHLGLYAYSAEFINNFSGMSPGRLEKIERLEQLRALENGLTIAVGITNEPTLGVDTPEDAAIFEKLVG